MKQNQIDELSRLNNVNLENIFNVYSDDNNLYYYNLLQTVEIPTDLPKGYYQTYTVKPEDTWPYISYKTYNTPNLWWLIVSVNGIINPTAKLPSGTVIKILKQGAVKSILEQITIQVN